MLSEADLELDGTQENYMSPQMLPFHLFLSGKPTF